MKSSVYQRDNWALLQCLSAEKRLHFIFVSIGKLQARYKWGKRQNTLWLGNQMHSYPTFKNSVWKSLLQSNSWLPCWDWLLRRLVQVSSSSLVPIEEPRQSNLDLLTVHRTINLFLRRHDFVAGLFWRRTFLTNWYFSDLQLPNQSCQLWKNN